MMSFRTILIKIIRSEIGNDLEEYAKRLACPKRLFMNSWPDTPKAPTVLPKKKKDMCANTSIELVVKTTVKTDEKKPPAKPKTIIKIGNRAKLRFPNKVE